MTITLQFAFLYGGQEIFVWSDCLPGTDFPVGNVVFVWDAYYYYYVLLKRMRTALETTGQAPKYFLSHMSDPQHSVAVDHLRLHPPSSEVRRPGDFCSGSHAIYALYPAPISPH